MIRTFRYGTIQAKIYGIYGKTYLGDRVREVSRIRRLTDLHRTLFPDDDVTLPEQELILRLQRKLDTRLIAVFNMVLDRIHPTPAVLVHLLRRYEYRTVKILIRSLDAPFHPDMIPWDIGRYRDISGEGAVTVRDALRGTRYAWLTEADSEGPIAVLENRLDRQYYSELWHLVRELPKKDRRGIEELVYQEILYQNIIWALRLKVFFGYNREQTEPLLIHEPESAAGPDVLEIFSFAPDSQQDWSSWSHTWLVEDQLTERFRGVDPVRAETKAYHYLSVRARKGLHKNLFTLGPFYAFFKLKELEVDILKSLVEGIRMAVPDQELVSFIEGYNVH